MSELLPAEVINAQLLRRGKSPLPAAVCEAVNGVAHLRLDKGIFDLAELELRTGTTLLYQAEKMRQRVEAGDYDDAELRDIEREREDYEIDAAEVHCRVGKHRDYKLGQAEATERTGVQHLARAYYLFEVLGPGHADIGSAGFRRLTEQLRQDLNEVFDCFRSSLYQATTSAEPLTSAAPPEPPRTP